MKHVLRIATIPLLCCGLMAPLPAQETAGKSVEGIWQGALAVSGIELRIVFKIHKQPGGKLSGTLDSPDQGAKDIPVDVVTFTNNTLRLELKAIGGVFEGKMNGGGTEIAGQWQQSGQALPLTVKRTDKPAEARRPQEPQKPYPYEEEDVTFENKAAGVKLAGTLTRPRTKDPVPAVLLIAGSGPNTRDEAVFGHRPFLVLADYLTRQGFAVLRYDKRGIGSSTGDFAQATTVEFADDALAGVDYLKQRKEIDPAKIGLIGHSEGGIIAPIVASRSKDVAFIVLMAGTGLTGEQILYLQGALIAKAMGAKPEAVARQKALQEQMFTIAKQEKDPATAEKKKKAGDPEKFAQAQIKTVLSPWMRYFLIYDPATALKEVNCPVLAINGEKDLQVPPKENLPAIEAALKAGGNKDYTIKELPGLNHLFQAATTGAPSEYSQIEITIDPVALKTMGDWISAHTRSAAAPGK